MVESAWSASLRVAAHLGACLVLATLGAPARATTYGDIEVTIQSEPKGKSHHGYFEYVFLVSNHSGERPHTVTVSIPNQRGFSGWDHIRDLRRTVRIGGNETARVELLQPDSPPVGGEDVTVFIDERRQEHPVPLRPNATEGRGGFYYGRSSYGRYTPGPSELLILKSRSISKEVPRVSLPSVVVGGGMSGGMAGMPAMPSRKSAKPPAEPPRAAPPKPKPGLPANVDFQLAEPVELWSHNWLAYSRYDGIVVTGDDLKAMSPAVRTALWQYVETGGALLVLGEADLRGLSVTGEKTSEDGWRLIESGFGRCIVSPDDNFDRWKDEHFQLIAASWSETVKPWDNPRNSYDANERFPVVEDIGIPIKGLFVLMFLFAVAIGPINFLVLARKKRRIWILWTTPAISLVTCLAVFGYMLLSEGWEGQLRTETFTLLDEGTHRATTVGWTAVYSPLTPSNGLHFSYETEVIPQRMNEGRRAGVRSCTLDWSRDQHLASGWVEARVPAHFKVRKSEMRHKRVNIHREADGKVSMVNALGAEITLITYADEHGRLYSGEHIAAGAPASLTPKNVPEVPQPVQTMRQVYLSSNWLIGAQGIASAPQRYLRPNSYLAEVDDSPFLEDALRKARTRKCHAVIMGVLKE
ncbi:MAG TPA: hypothetical protein VH643_08630 [Gemmataceae bacterium]|jgi:hypothetical protein